jgi:hypothetical protein
MSDEMKSGLELHQVLDELRKPFHPSQVTWKPGAVKGERALALAYADLRAYMNRLDEVCGSDWSVAYEGWGNDRIICRLTICGVTRSSTGETTNEAERSEIGGTVAEAQAFKRASAMFGLGRYLYNLPTGWADYDPATKKFTEKAKGKLMGILMQHYRRATDTKTEMAELFNAESSQEEGADQEHEANDNSKKDNGRNVDGNPELTALFEQFDTLGYELYGDQWQQVCRRNVSRITGGKTQKSGELTPEQIEKLIAGMLKVKSKREPEAVPA